MSRDGVMPQLPYGDRIQFGQQFKWDPATQEWETASGRKVFVSPPNSQDSCWYVRVPTLNIYQPVTEQYAEERAFCLADAYSRKKN